MQRILLVVAILVLFVGNVAHAQKALLRSDGWGSISGKVTLDGDLPKVISFEDKMKAHADKACCLAPAAKPIEKIDSIWMVDPKTKAVANVIVWAIAPKGTYFPTHEKYMKRADHVVIDQPHCAFLPRVSVCNPVYIDDKGEVATGQKVVVKNSSVAAHNVRMIGTKNGFNQTLPAKTEIEKLLEPEKLPVTVQCDIHPWMGARLLVLDHPYYAVSKEDGTFAIPFVPAGAEFSLIAWHEAKGYVLFADKSKVTPENKKNTVVNIQVAP